MVLAKNKATRVILTAAEWGFTMRLHLHMHVEVDLQCHNVTSRDILASYSLNSPDTDTEMAKLMYSYLRIEVCLIFSQFDGIILE